MGYPFGKFFQLLLLTALRRNEAADARWSEIDLDAKLWVIPAERMKGGAAHAVPLVPDIMAPSRKPSPIQGRRFPLLNNRRQKARQRLLAKPRHGWMP